MEVKCPSCGVTFSRDNKGKCPQCNWDLAGYLEIEKYVKGIQDSIQEAREKKNVRRLRKLYVVSYGLNPGADICENAIHDFKKLGDAISVEFFRSMVEKKKKPRIKDIYFILKEMIQRSIIGT